MVTIRSTETFDAWLAALRDIAGKARILARIDRLRLGNPGDCRSVGDGVMEMRIHAGPGYRIYYVSRGAELIILLAGGDKGSQARDIAFAKRMEHEIGE